MMRRGAVCLSLALATATPLASPGSAGADTIYLVNGRKIHTESATIRDGRVVFTQFGGTVSIPLDRVVRIVDDDETEQPIRRSAPLDAGTASPPPSVDMTGPQRRDTAPSTVTTATPVPDNAVEPWRMPEYWIERINEVDARIERVQTELDRLPVYSETDRRLFRFSGQIRYFIAEREKWESLMGGMQLRRRQLVHGARKAGVTPGALRNGLAKRAP